MTVSFPELIILTTSRILSFQCATCTVVKMCENAGLEEQVEQLEKSASLLNADQRRRVVVVTPKICVSMPTGQMEEVGRMELPLDVLRKLVATQLGYEVKDAALQ